VGRRSNEQIRRDAAVRAARLATAERVQTATDLTRLMMDRATPPDVATDAMTVLTWLAARKD